MRNYLFAWSTFTDKGRRYTAVMDNSTHELFHSYDWDAFYKETKLFCCDLHLHFWGESKRFPEMEISIHKRYSKPFIVFENCIVILEEDDIIYFPEEHDPEAVYRAQFQ